MVATLRTRKPVDRLTQTDLSAFPIWVFAADEEHLSGADETWVRPVRAHTVSPQLSSCIVAAKFRISSGRQLNGVAWVEGWNTESPGDGGAILFQRKYMPIPGAHSSDAFSLDLRRRVRAFASALGETTSTVFPISYHLAVGMAGESARRVGVFKLPPAP